MRINKSMKQVLLLLLLPFVISCKKNDEDPSMQLQDGKSVVITDLAGDTQASMGVAAPGKQQRPFHIFLFRFKDQKQIWIRNAADSARYLKTNEWDIAFTGPYNSEVYVNKGSYEFNPGYGGPADSKVVMVRQAYQNVKQAPSDAEFEQSTINKIGWASDDNDNGWFYYDMNTHLMRSVSNRTYVIRLPDGKYVKLQLVNVYKGNPPAVTDLNWPAPYLTFRYYIQNDGGRNLDTQS